MRRQLVRTPAFVRGAKRYLKKHPMAIEMFAILFAKLEADAFDASLRTHKLKGELTGYWACSGGYDVRVIVKLERIDAGESVVLHAVGMHDEVY